MLNPTRLWINILWNLTTRST